MIEMIGTIIFLAILEGLLSFDNALALAAMVKHLPEEQRKRALTYGMIGAFVFRTIAIFFVTFLISNPWIKVIGAAYLLYLAIKFFFFDDEQHEANFIGSFWRTVIMVELADIAFSIDSIIAAVGVSTNRTIIIIGGILGIIMMRFAALIFTSLIEKFPRLEQSAFILIAIVGTKILLEVFFHLPFHDKGTIYFVGFWVAMLTGLGYGFTKKIVV